MKRNLVKSEDLQRRANQVIAHGALTNSKRPASFVEGVYPTHVLNGIGAKVWDVDGYQYIDYICGLGSQLFGYRNPRIDTAAVTQMHRGTVFSLGTELEVEVAEAVQNEFSYIQKLRFLKTGSEACAAAVRIARAFTGKSEILSDGYHGWHDEFVCLTPPATGIPFSSYMRRLAEVEVNKFTAAVIIEPVITDASSQRLEWLKRLREQCSEFGALLIFDETITGLRFPGFSVAKHIGIDPDLSIMGKAIGGGFPLALVGGRSDVMDADYFVSSTFAGDCVALAAAKEVLKLIREPGLVEGLHQKAGKFCADFNALSPALITIEGYGTRGVFRARNAMTQALFFQECCKAGVLFGPSFFYGTEHPQHDETTLSICRTVLKRIENNEVQLEGKLPVVPYAQKVRAGLVIGSLGC